MSDTASEIVAEAEAIEAARARIETLSADQIVDLATGRTPTITTTPKEN